MKSDIDLEIKEFGRRAGVEISMFEGASVITTNEDDEVWLESPIDSALVVVHTSLEDNVHESRIGLETLNKILSLNGQIDKMKGTWVSIHEGTSSIRLCLAIPKELSTADTLEQVFNNIITIKGEVKDIIH